MTDTLSQLARSERMALIRAKNTKPELWVRHLIHSLGYRYRLHRRTLPGVPDLVFPSRRAVIFVHGCFWHRHKGCEYARLPKSRLSYWIPKLEGNKERDRKNLRALLQAGWRILVIWECEVRRNKNIAPRIAKFLGPTRLKAA